MGQYGTGAKSGALAGLVYGVIIGISAYILLSYVFRDSILAQFQNVLNSETNVPAGVTPSVLLTIAVYGALI